MKVPPFQLLVMLMISVLPSMQKTYEIILLVLIVCLNDLSDNAFFVFPSPLVPLLFHLHFHLSLCLQVLIVLLFQVFLQSVGDVHLVALAELLHLRVLKSLRFEASLAVLGG